jgi:hypothetical protein
MAEPYEVEWKNNEQGHILYAICYCDTAKKYDVRIYGGPSEGCVAGSPMFETLEEAQAWAANQGGE